MYAAWRVSVTLTASNMTGSAFIAFISYTQTANTATMKLNLTISQFRSAAINGFGAASTAMSAFVAKGLNDAGNFQQAMTTVFNTIGAKGSMRDTLQAMVMSVSGTTQQSAQTIAEEMAAAGQAGLTAQQIKDFFPKLAMYADLQMNGPGHANPVDAIKTAIQIGHLEGAYTGSDVSNMVERLNKLGYSQPESMDRILTQGKYFIPEARKLGMSIDETLNLVAMMGQTGLLRGRGGTGVAAVIDGMLKGPSLTGHAALIKQAALTGLGVIDSSGKNQFVDSQGQIEFSKLITHLAQVSDREKPDLFYQQLAGAFSKTAIPFLEAVLRPETRAQVQRTQDRMSNMGSIDDMFAERQKNYQTQMNTLGTNFQNLIVAIFLPTLQYVTPVIAGMANELKSAAVFLMAHPHLGLAISVGAIASIGIAMTAAAALSVSSLWSVIGSLNALAAASGRTAGVNLFSMLFGGTGGGGRAIGGVLGALFNPFGLVGGAGKLLGGAGRYLGGGLMVGLEAMFGGIASAAMRVLPWVARLAFGIGEFGLHFLPIIGWAVLAVQALMYFHHNPNTIGKWVGTFVGYIKYHLIPESTKAVTEGSKFIVDAFSTLMTNIWKSITSIFQPTNGKSFFDQLVQDGKKFTASFQAAEDAQKPKPASGRSGKQDGSGHTTHTVHHTHEVALTMNKREVARVTLDHMNSRASHNIRAGAGATTMPRMSALSVQGALN